MEMPLRVLITGTNKGIGYELVKIFLKLQPAASILATSRQAPAAAYKQWQGIDPKGRVKCLYLDVGSKDSIRDFAMNVEKEGSIDILINNAGVSRTDDINKLDNTAPDLSFSKECLTTNVLGPIELTQRLLPRLSETAKVINISSLYGGLKIQPEIAQKKFADPSITKEDITQSIEQYIKEIEGNKVVSFSHNVYATSKMLLGAWSRFVLQRKWLKAGQKAICVTPGLCLTPMTHDIAPEMRVKAWSAENGAMKIYETIFLPNVDPNVFYHRARVSDFMRCGSELPWE